MYNQAKGTFRDFPFDLSSLDLAAGLSTGQLTGNIRISRTSEGLLFQSTFHTQIPAVCVRCLEEFIQPLDAEFTELYTFPDPFAIDQSARDEQELVLPEDGYIDVAPLLREYLLLEFPIKPLHDPDCKGLCPQCGVNWNHTTCEHYSSPDHADQENTSRTPI